MPGNVAEGFTEHRKHLLGHARGHQRVHRALEGDLRFEPEGPRGRLERSEDGRSDALAGVRSRALQSEDRRADLLDGGVEIVDSAAYPLGLLRWLQSAQRPF